MPGKDPRRVHSDDTSRHCGVDRRNLARSGDWMVSGGTVGRTNHVSGGSGAAPRHLSRGAKTFSLIAVLHSRSTPRASLSLRMGERIVGPRTYETRQFDLANVAISSTAL